jgi:hypothetical protein
LPEYVFCGTATAIVGVTVNVPTPVALAALKNLPAVGGEDAAGTVIGKVSELLGVTQMPPLAHRALTPVTIEAVVAKVRVPVVN